MSVTPEAYIFVKEAVISGVFVRKTIFSPFICFCPFVQIISHTSVVLFLDSIYLIDMFYFVVVVAS